MLELRSKQTGGNELWRDQEHKQAVERRRRAVDVRPEWARRQLRPPPLNLPVPNAAAHLAVQPRSEHTAAQLTVSRVAPHKQSRAARVANRQSPLRRRRAPRQSLARQRSHRVPVTELIATSCSRRSSPTGCRQARKLFVLRQAGLMTQTGLRECAESRWFARANRS